ncbi:Smr/MutS family protein [Thiomicrospira sp. S5]|jgi:DNA-nicking Smr family endonuclease|uniref:Smr/MutS family protein n=1 Tax=Thiomicrospira sp. S5 TaxID=1803865 RepID=UPI000F8A1B91|nr:Smr/MutS family protein [Thiomicrospira sp. S5]AZR82050.1 hypothetical protein AYJ59_06955 [Thiomicrospira sp. S5]
MSHISDEDKSLFAEAVQGTQKLNSRKTVATVAPKSQPPLRHKRRSTSPEPGQLFQGNDQAWPSRVSAFEYIEYQHPNCSAQDFKRLRKGDFKTRFCLDLHGHTELEAEKALEHFIHEALQSQARYLIIVHGKGYHSESDYPVLKNLVNYRLPQIPDLLGFCSAQPKDGGTGAVYVFLKNQR